MNAEVARSIRCTAVANVTEAAEGAAEAVAFDAIAGSLGTVADAVAA